MTRSTPKPLLLPVPEPSPKPVLGSVANATGATRRVRKPVKKRKPLPGGWNATGVKLLLAVPYKGRRLAEWVERDLWWVRQALWYGQTFADIEDAMRGVEMIWPNLARESWNPCLVFSKRGTTPGYTLYVRAREAARKQATAGNVAARIAKALYG